MYYTIFTINNLKIVISGDKNGISQLQLDNGTKPVTIENEWRQNDTFFTNAQEQLTEYFGGKRTTFDLKLNPIGTDYQRKVWNALCEIPYGEAYSYKQIAELTGNPKASRAVGLANNRNPIPLIIPCHRVVGTNKKLVGYAYGLELKQQLLESEKINTIFEKLSKYYGNINRNAWGGKQSWWPANAVFEMMVGAILTQNTNWKNVEKALDNLGDDLTPQYILNAANDELAAKIRSSGYHNQKALKLKALCQWFEQYNFDIEKAGKESLPKLREELLAIKGVGGETADSILVYALNKPSFVIDAYTRRLIGRVGIDVPTDYEIFRRKMETAVPQSVKTYDYYHGLIVEHAKAFCTKKPQCAECPLNNICEKTDLPKQTTLAL